MILLRRKVDMEVEQKMGKFQKKTLIDYGGNCIEIAEIKLADAGKSEFYQSSTKMYGDRELSAELAMDGDDGTYMYTVCPRSKPKSDAEGVTSAPSSVRREVLDHEYVWWMVKLPTVELISDITVRPRQDWGEGIRDAEVEVLIGSNLKVPTIDPNRHCDEADCDPYKLYHIDFNGYKKCGTTRREIGYNDMSVHCDVAQKGNMVLLRRKLSQQVLESIAAYKEKYLDDYGGNCMDIAEVMIYKAESNYFFYSSIDHDTNPGAPFDKDPDTQFKTSCSHPDSLDKRRYAWWMVVLGKSKKIKSVGVLKGTGGVNDEGQFEVFVSNNLPIPYRDATRGCRTAKQKNKECKAELKNVYTAPAKGRRCGFVEEGSAANSTMPTATCVRPMMGNMIMIQKQFTDPKSCFAIKTVKITYG